MDRSSKLGLEPDVMGIFARSRSVVNNGEDSRLLESKGRGNRGIFKCQTGNRESWRVTNSHQLPRSPA